VNPEGILTPDEVAARLKVKRGFITENCAAVVRILFHICVSDGTFDLTGMRSPRG
jgi:hypothetical protein